MKISLTIKKISLAVLAGSLILGSLAWQTHSGPFATSGNDTVPDHNKKVRNIDDVIQELDKAQVDLEKNYDKKNWEKMRQDIRESVQKAQVDVEKMKGDIQKSVEELQKQDFKAEMDGARAGIEAARKEIEANKDLSDEQVAHIKEQLDKALQNIDMKKIQEETQKALAQVDMSKIQTDVMKNQKIAMEKMEDQLKGLGPTIEQSMKKAHEDIEKARKEMNDYKSFLSRLNKDGLIKEEDGYRIEYKAGNLYINGQKQADDVKDRYNDFLHGHKNFTIKKDAEGFDIENDSHFDWSPHFIVLNI